MGYLHEKRASLASMSKLLAGKSSATSIPPDNKKKLPNFSAPPIQTPIIATQPSLSIKTKSMPPPSENETQPNLILENNMTRCQHQELKAMITPQ